MDLMLLTERLHAVGITCRLMYDENGRPTGVCLELPADHPLTLAILTEAVSEDAAVVTG